MEGASVFYSASAENSRQIKKPSDGRFGCCCGTKAKRKLQFSVIILLQITEEFVIVVSSLMNVEP